MTFKSQLTADVSAVFFNTAEFAGVGTFKSFSTNAETANVPFIITIGAADSSQPYGVADAASIMIPVSALSVEPQRHDTLTFNSTVYTLQDRFNADDNVYQYSVESEERHNPK